MTKSRANPKVDFFFRQAETWRAEMEKLREIALDCELDEELKWGKPCYAFEGSNVVIIQPFKEYCALLFCKGALLKDPKCILIQQTENVQAARQARFTHLREIVAQEAALKAFIRQAIEAEKLGLEVKLKTTAEFKMPEELQNKLRGSAAFKKAFTALTPGRQRGYILYFGAAKRSATRDARIVKCTPQILAGRGLND